MCIIFLSHLAIADAQGLFRYERVDFFGKAGISNEAIQPETKENPETIVDDWAEPIISPSGKVSIYVPPKEVRDFLEKPDPENARAYLEWNSKRINKFILAQELLAKEVKGLGYMNDAKTLVEDNSLNSSFGGSKDNARVEANYLFYFMLKGCPICEKESRIIEDIYLHYPEIRIEAFAKGFSDKELERFKFSARQDNGMSSIFKISSYPSIVIFNRKKERYSLSGYQDGNKIMSLLE